MAHNTEQEQSILPNTSTALTTEQEQRIKKLYRALAKKHKYVAKLYGDSPPEQDLLQRYGSACNNTILHIAIRFRQFKLVDLLLETLPESLSNIKNDDGDTILHELAANDDSADRAEKVADKDPGLLIALNNLKETPIFSAARHGQVSMFQLLARKLVQHHGADVKEYLQRDGKTTVLHIAITAEHFDLAYAIAEEHQYLINEKDQDGMTAFQHLACNQKAFAKKKMGEGSWEDSTGWKMIKDLQLKDIFKKKNKREGLWEDSTTRRGMTKDATQLKNIFKKASGTCEPPPERENSLQSLVKILVTKDTRWHVGIHFQIGESHRRNISRKEDTKVARVEKWCVFKKNDESPLFLAVMSNNREIVEEIILQHAFVLNHVSKEGMNILQVAILFGNVEIFDLMINSKVLPNSLLSAIDNEGNSLAHMVGQYKSSHAIERMQNPAMQLRKECKFFQKVKAACNMHLIKPLNDHHQTAEELFAAANEKLHQEAKEWLLRTTENCTILSVFIATVAFAAAYTVPGGPNQSTGIPLLSSKPWFVVFIVADVISLSLSLTSVGIFLSILTSSFPLQDFETYLFQKLRWGIIIMILSVSMMAMAFGSTVVLIMTNNWGHVFSILVGFLPVPIFFLSYSPLRSVVLDPFTEAFTTFAAKFLVFVLVLLIFFLPFLPYAAVNGLRWIGRRAFKFFKHKLDSHRRGQQSNVQTFTP